MDKDKKQPYWAHEQLDDDWAADIWAVFWTIINESYTTDWEWVQLEEHVKALRAND